MVRDLKPDSGRETRVEEFNESLRPTHVVEASKIMCVVTKHLLLQDGSNGKSPGDQRFCITQGSGRTVPEELQSSGKPFALEQR